MSSEDRASEIAQRIAEELQREGKPLAFFTAEHSSALEELAKLYSENPKAIEAWVWIYDTYGRLRFLGLSLSGTLKWFLVMVATVAAIKTGVVEFLVGLFNGK